MERPSRSRKPRSRSTSRHRYQKNKTEINSTKENQSKERERETSNLKEINVLLLGETGVGKSTFLNSFVNYIVYKEFQNAIKFQPILAIPSQLTIYTKDFQKVKINVGEDENEHTKTGVSSTQDTKSYVFPLGDGLHKIRIIDTPGIGDTRGVEQDLKNLEGIFNHINNIEELHAICILLKPDAARLTTIFEFCFMQLLTHLEKSAADNLFFIFTNSRNTSFKAGNTLGLLDTLLQQVNSNSGATNISLKQDNTFHVDNEGFRFLLAKQYFEEEEIDQIERSWNASFHECMRFINNIVGTGCRNKMIPHNTNSTGYVNRLRKNFKLLLEIYTAFSELSLSYIEEIKKYNIKIANLQKKERTLLEKLYLTCEKKLEVPIRGVKMICRNSLCPIMNVMNDTTKEACHYPCEEHLLYGHIIGHPDVAQCRLFDQSTQKCQKCHCSFQSHQQIKTETICVTSQEENPAVREEINQNAAGIRNLSNKKEKQHTHLENVNRDKKRIEETLKAVAAGLKNNSLLPYNGSFKKYLEFIIEREKTSGYKIDQNIMKKYNSMLLEFEEEMRILNGVLYKMVGNISLKSLKSLDDEIKALLELQSLVLLKKRIKANENPPSSKYSDLEIQLPNMTKRFSEKRRKSEGKLPITEVRREFVLQPHLIGFALGKKGRNLSKCKLIEGIINIELKANLCIITGMNEKALDEAQEILHIKEIKHPVPNHLLKYFSENNEAVLKQIKEDCHLCIYHILPSNNKSKNHLISFIGSQDSIKQAKLLLLKNIEAFNSMDKINGTGQDKNDTYSAINLKNVCPLYIEEFYVPKHLIQIVKGENRKRLLDLFDIEGFENVEIEEETGKIVLYGENKDCVILAKENIEIIEEKVVVKYGKILIPSEENEKILKEIKLKSKLIEIKVLLVEASLVFIGTKTSVNVAKQLLDVYWESFSQKDLRDHKNEKCHCIEIEISSGLIGWAIGKNGVNLERAKSIPGILKIDIVKDSSKFIVYGKTLEAVEEAYDVLDIKEDRLVVPTTHISKIIGKNGTALKKLESSFYNLKIQILTNQETAKHECVLSILGPKKSVNKAKEFLTIKVNEMEVNDKEYAQTRTYPNRTIITPNFSGGLKFFNALNWRGPKREMNICSHHYGWAVGKNNVNLLKVESLPGIMKIVAIPELSKFIIYGKSVEAIEQAYDALDIITDTLAVPWHLTPQMIGKEGSFIINLESKFTNLRINTMFERKLSQQSDIFEIIGPRKTVHQVMGILNRNLKLFKS